MIYLFTKKGCDKCEKFRVLLKQLAPDLKYTEFDMDVTGLAKLAELGLIQEAQEALPLLVSEDADGNLFHCDGYIACKRWLEGIKKPKEKP